MERTEGTKNRPLIPIPAFNKKLEIGQTCQPACLFLCKGENFKASRIQAEAHPHRFHDALFPCPDPKEALFPVSLIHPGKLAFRADPLCHVDMPLIDYLYVSPDICRIAAGEDADRAAVRDAERRCSRQYGLYPILIDFDQCYF